MKAVYIGIDPGFSHVGIVAIDTGGSVIDAEHIHYEATHNDEQTYEQWEMVAHEVEETLDEMKHTYSARRHMEIGLLAPIITRNPLGAMKLHVATGVILGMARGYGQLLIRKDLAVRQALGLVIGCPVEFKINGKKSDRAKTLFVQEFWKECSNAHLADAWLMARYTLLQRG